MDELTEVVIKSTREVKVGAKKPSCLDIKIGIAYNIIVSEPELLHHNNHQALQLQVVNLSTPRRKPCQWKILFTMEPELMKSLGR